MDSCCQYFPSCCSEGLLSHCLVTNLTNSFPISPRDPEKKPLSIHSLASVHDERKLLEVVRVNGDQREDVLTKLPGARSRGLFAGVRGQTLLGQSRGHPAAQRVS